MPAKTNPYPRVKDPNCSRRWHGWSYEHHSVVERVLGKPLPPKAVVHHVNGDEQDNRPCNLVICENQGYHRLLHAREDALEACGHAGWLKCEICGQWDDPANLSQRHNPRKNRVAYHAACARARYHTKYRERAIERYHERKLERAGAR